ncbi:MAG: flippase-like domain-containing protein [Chloroflexi bacterium]|nr:flippase-like domain-containing protein [Chloroflexota bacterium]
MSVNKGVFLRVLGSIILIILVFRSANLSEIIDTLKNIDISLYIFSFLIFLGNKFVVSYRWKRLLQVQNIQARLWALYKVNLLGTIFNNILPSTLGGESVRIYWLVKEFPGKKTASVVATLADKLLGLVALVFLAIVFLPLNTIIDPPIKITALVILGGGLVMLGLLVWSPGNWGPVLMRKLMFNEWLKIRFEKILTVLKTFKRSKGTMSAAFLLAILFQVISVANHFLRFRSIGVDVPIQYLFFAIPITTLIVTIPISIGGIGLREMSLIGLLGIVGIENVEVVAYTLVSYSAVLLLSIGLAFYNIVDKPFRKLWRDLLSADQINYKSDIDAT